MARRLSKTGYGVTTALQVSRISAGAGAKPPGCHPLSDYRLVETGGTPSHEPQVDAEGAGQNQMNRVPGPPWFSVRAGKCRPLDFNTVKR